MYLTLNQVTLIRDVRKLRPGDPVIYERELNGQRVLTTDGGPSQYATTARPYGHLYFDARGEPCVIPSMWNEEDTSLVREAIGKVEGEEKI